MTSGDYATVILAAAGLVAAAFLFGLILWIGMRWLKFPMMVEEKLNAIGKVLERIEQNTRQTEPDPEIIGDDR